MTSEVISVTSELISETSELVSETTEMVSEYVEVISEVSKNCFEPSEVISVITEITSEGENFGYFFRKMNFISDFLKNIFRKTIHMYKAWNETNSILFHYMIVILKTG